MVKKIFLSVILFVFVFLSSGCTVAKGAAGFCLGAKEGAQDDWDSLQHADAWMRTNLW